MAYPKGKPKPEGSGRKKGTPNKSTLDLHAICERLGVNPFEKLVEYIVHPCDTEIRLAALKEICSYLYPKRKAVEHSGAVEVNNKYAGMSIEELEAEAARRLKESKKK